MMLTWIDSSGQARVANEAALLIQRYPDLPNREIDRLVSIYPRVPIVDIALMASDDVLGPRLEEFTRTERRRLRPPFSHFIGLLSPVFLLLFVAFWLFFR